MPNPICETCIPKARYYGPLFRDGSWHLAYDPQSLEYCIVDRNGHDVALRFAQRPFPDPERSSTNRRLSEKAQERIYERMSPAQHRKLDLVADELMRIEIPVQTVVHLHASALAAGYEEALDGHLLVYLFHRAGYVLKRAKRSAR